MSEQQTLLPFAQRLQALRTAQGLSSYRLAQASGLAASYIYKLERGRIVRPSALTLERLAQALGVSVAELWDAPVWEQAPPYGVAEQATTERVRALLRRCQLPDPEAFLRQVVQLSRHDQGVISVVVRTLGSKQRPPAADSEHTEPGAEGTWPGQSPESSREYAGTDAGIVEWPADLAEVARTLAQAADDLGQAAQQLLRLGMVLDPGERLFKMPSPQTAAPAGEDGDGPAEPVVSLRRT